jgi:hypothetical protein
MEIKKITDGQIVELSSLGIEELNFLHYEQELRYAALIRAEKPFSTERTKLLHDGYKMVVKIAKAKKALEGNKISELTYGVQVHYIALVKNVIGMILNAKKNMRIF